MSRPFAVATLILCTFLWGIAFVFQKGAMDHMGPFVFTAIRYIMGGFLILPLAIREYSKRPLESHHFDRRRWTQFIILMLSFSIGVWAQQIALKTTTVTNGGFLTSLYVIFTPLAAYVLLRIRPHPIIYVGAPLALIGIYFLTGANLQSFSPGDAMLIFCAVCWAVQIAVLAPLVQETGLPVTISAAAFFFTGILSLIGIPFEHPTWEGISSGWIEILYTTVMSTAVAFTLQAIGQQYVPASNAAIILSAESLFAAAAGAILLSERLPPVGYAGAAMIFIAILLVELVPAMHARAATSSPGSA